MHRLMSYEEKNNALGSAERLFKNLIDHQKYPTVCFMFPSILDGRQIVAVIFHANLCFLRITLPPECLFPEKQNINLRSIPPVTRLTVHWRPQIRNHWLASRQNFESLTN